MIPRRLAPLLFLLVTILAMAPASATPIVDRATWRIGFELAFAEGAPYRDYFGDLYALPYAESARISQDVLGKIVEHLLAETGLKEERLYFGPSGWDENPVQPSAQLEVQATEAEAQMLADAIGYLAQQGAVIASTRVDESLGDAYALELFEVSPSNLSKPDVAHRFWQVLRKTFPEIGDGFAPLRARFDPDWPGVPGFYIINTGDPWTTDQLVRFQRDVDGISGRDMIRVLVGITRVDYFMATNDWAVSKGGEEYLERLRNGPQPELASYCQDRLQPLVKKWINASRFLPPGNYVEALETQSPCQPSVSMPAILPLFASEVPCSVATALHSSPHCCWRSPHPRMCSLS